MAETKGGLTEGQFVAGCEAEMKKASDYAAIRMDCVGKPRVVAVGMFSAAILQCYMVFDGEARAKLRPILYQMIDEVWEEGMSDGCED